MPSPHIAPAGHGPARNRLTIWRNMRASRPGRVRDAVAGLAAWGGAGAVVLAFLWIVGDVVGHGIGRVDWHFLTEAPANAGRAGGIAPILVSTALVLAVCLAAVVPLGLGAAVFLAEVCRAGGRAATLVRRSLDLLAGVPSIVFGLFGAALFVQVLGLGFSILSGGLTLACMVLPFLTRTTEAALAAVPTELRLGGAALGLGKWTVLARVLLPVAAPALVAGLVLGIGRALAETAALVFTSGYVDRYPASLLDSGRVLSIHILDLAMNVPGGDTNAYASATVLLMALLLVNIAAGRAARRWVGAGTVAP